MTIKFIPILLFLLSSICISCDSENAKIKKSLKASIPNDTRNYYKYESHDILETILKTNLTDSILALENDISVIRKTMHLDSLRLANIHENMAECKHQRNNTMYFLRSTYDQIIENYKEMEADIIEELTETNDIITVKEAKIDFLSKAMYESNSPIVFYKVRHIYKMHGMLKDTTVLLNTKYEIVK